MSERFYQLKHSLLDQVQTEQLTIKDIGLIGLLGLLSNPHNGYVVTNFSMIAGQFNDRQHEIARICERLKRLGQIYYETSQGKRQFYIFVLGLQMAGSPGGQPRFVTPEYISKIIDSVEVISHFEKFKKSFCIEKKSEKKGNSVEVPYIDTDIDKKLIINRNTGEIYQELVKVHGEGYAKRYLAERGYLVSQSISEKNSETI